MKIDKTTVDTWCARFAVSVTLAGIAFVAGFFSIIWGIV